jgi:hypothetical protein
MACWRPPSHIHMTTKLVEWARSLWDGYVTRDDGRHPSSTRACVAGSMLSFTSLPRALDTGGENLSDSEISGGERRY